MADLGLFESLPDDLRRVMAEARERARAIAVERLADRYADALVAAAGQARVDRREPVERQPASHDGWYVYAIVGQPAPEGTVAERGLDGAAVSAVPAGTIAALASRVDVESLRRRFDEADARPDGWFAQAAARHDAVVRGAFERTATLPLRLGCVVDSAERLRDLLGRHEQRLREQLTALTGCAEWSIDLRRVAEPDEPDAGRPPASGAGYLQERSARRLAAARRGREAESLIGSVFDALAESCQELIAPPPDAGTDALRAHALVANDRAAQFLARADTFGAQLRERGWELECSGPWPCYHFMNADLLGGSDA